MNKKQITHDKDNYKFTFAISSPDEFLFYYGTTAEIKKNRKPRNGAAVITASMHGFANC